LFLFCFFFFFGLDGGVCFGGGAISSSGKDEGTKSSERKGLLVIDVLFATNGL
jgi:hypothetical protein